MNQLKENLVKTNAELGAWKQKFNLSSRKLNFTKNATEQKILESISNKDFFRDDPHLISVYSATLNLEDFEEEEAGDTLTPKKDNFLKKVEDSIDKDDSTQTERYLHIKNQILEKVKASKNRQRTFSGSSTTSVGSRGSKGSGLKRTLSGGQDGKSPNRMKSGIPALK